jgi:multidrug efflux pump subunit AcrB
MAKQQLLGSKVFSTLAFATFLTLVVVPVMYRMIDVRKTR